MNLIEGQIQNSNIFTRLPRFDKIFYDGYLEGKVRKYRALREELACHILVLNVIRKDEDVIWGAFEDLIKRSVENAAVAVSGVYVFDVLTKDIHKEVKTYKHAEITALLINHARKCAPGEKRLIKYSSIYGILHKLNAVDWGKITLKTAVEIFKDKDIFLDLMLKKIIKNFEFASEPGLLMINDLSQAPIYNAEDEMQQKRLSALMAKQIPTSIEFPPEVYIQDKNGIRELYSGLQV
ncbi:MAG: hypothetical protein KAS66_10125 [Candidatus Omnitrophica bacterium]|nr:hypothetical protein [Candidatus Omnitrophota bacterium]